MYGYINNNVSKYPMHRCSSRRSYKRNRALQSCTRVVLPLANFGRGSVTLMGGMNIFVWTSGLHFRSAVVSTTLLLMFRLSPADMAAI